MYLWTNRLLVGCCLLLVGCLCVCDMVRLSGWSGKSHHQTSKSPLDKQLTSRTPEQAAHRVESYTGQAAGQPESRSRKVVSNKQPTSRKVAPNTLTTGPPAGKGTSEQATDQLENSPNKQPKVAPRQAAGGWLLVWCDFPPVRSVGCLSGGDFAADRLLVGCDFPAGRLRVWKLDKWVVACVSQQGRADWGGTHHNGAVHFLCVSTLPAVSICFLGHR